MYYMPWAVLGSRVGFAHYFSAGIAELPSGGFLFCNLGSIAAWTFGLGDLLGGAEFLSASFVFDSFPLSTASDAYG